MCIRDRRVSARADVADNVVVPADAPNVEPNELVEFWGDNLLTTFFDIIFVEMSRQLPAHFISSKGL